MLVGIEGLRGGGGKNVIARTLLFLLLLLLVVHGVLFGLLNLSVDTPDGLPSNGLVLRYLFVIQISLLLMFSSQLN